MKKYTLDLEGVQESFLLQPECTSDCRFMRDINPRVFETMSDIKFFDKKQSHKKMIKVMQAEKWSQMPKLEITDVVELIKNVDCLSDLKKEPVRPEQPFRLIGLKRAMVMKRRVL